MTRLLSTTALTLGACLATASAAAAQTYQAPPVQPRSGLLLGFGAGLGNIACSSVDGTCDDTEEAGGGSLHIGGMVNPRFAIVVDAWAMVHAEDGVTLAHTITTVGARWWVTPRLWLAGGLGAAFASLSLDAEVLGVDVEAESRTDSVPAVMGAIGFDLASSAKFALSLELKGGTGFYDDDNVRAHNASVGVGLTWF